MKTQRVISAAFLGMLLAVAGCGSKQSAEQPAGTPEAGGGKSAAPAKRAEAVTIPAGTVLHVTVDQSISTKTSQSGQEFGASLAEPVSVGGTDVIPKGATCTGVISEAKAAGKFKGGAVLKLALTSVTIGNKSYPLQTSMFAEVSKGKGKRTAVAVGGGAGLGAIIGGIAGGGKGALIGGLVGAGAGTAGAYFTGNRDITVPAETRLSFKLEQPLEVSK
jgi:hypothetical protein